jgi:putative peptidoglycan lipid II flippase
MKKNIIKTFSFMFVAMLLAKILGLLRNIVFANFYGTGFEATAFLTASRIPLQLLDITLGAAISSAFIPVFNEHLQSKSKEEAIKFSNNFLNIIVLISFILTILGIVFAPYVVKLIAPNLNIQTFNLTVSLIKILFPIMILTATAYVFVGFLQSLDEFNIPAIISVLSNGVLILYLLIFNNKFGITGVAVAMLIGWSMQILIQLPTARKRGFKYIFYINFKDDGFIKVIHLALPILICSWVQPINNIINISLASGLEDGRAVPAIDYAYSLFLITVGVFSYTLSNIIFPELSKLNTDKQDDKFTAIINKAIKLSIFFLIPISVIVAFLSKDIVKIIYERGEFGPESTILTSTSLMIYSIGIIGYGIQEILNKSFYAMQDAKTPMKISLFIILLNIILSIIFVKSLGYIGLPLAASITSIINSILLIFFINRKHRGIVNKDTSIYIEKTLFAIAIVALVLTLLDRINLYGIFRILILAGAGLITYFLITYLFKVEETKVAIEIIKNRFPNK